MPSSLTTEHFQFCAKHAAFDKLYGLQRSFSDHAVTTDGRKRKKIIRELFEQGYIIPSEKGNGANFVCTDRGYVLTNSTPFDLASLTVSLLTNKEFDPRYDVNVASWIIDPAIVKWLYEHKNESLWFVLDESPLKYSSHAYSDNPWTLNSDENEKGARWYGPESLEDAQFHLQEWFKKATNTQRMPVLAFTTKEFMEKAKTIRQNERINKAILENMPWALNELLVIAEEQAKTVHCSDSVGGRFFLHPSSGINLGPDTAKWPEKLEENAQRCIDLITKLNDNLATIKAIQSNIITYGGWEKFLNDYKARIQKEFSLPELPTVK